MITARIPESLQIFFFFNFLSLLYIRISGKNINVDDKKSKKREFYKNKKVTIIDDIDNKKLVSKKEPYGTKNSFKYFIGYNDIDVRRPLCVRLPQMTSYAKKCLLGY